MSARPPLRGRQCECTGCDERFSAPSTFERHRVGPSGARRCMTAEEMRADGMRLIDDVWRGEPMPEALRGRLE